jgi:hypothetical protein
MRPRPAASTELAPRDAPPPSQVRILDPNSFGTGLAAWPLEWVMEAIPPGEALDAGGLLARLQFTGAAVPAFCTLQHRLHEGWIKGFLARTSAGRSRYRCIPGVALVGRPAGLA